MLRRRKIPRYKLVYHYPPLDRIAEDRDDPFSCRYIGHDFPSFLGLRVKVTCRRCGATKEWVEVQ